MPDSVKKYFYEQIINISHILDLGMTTEELMVCHLVQMLPAPYRKELRDGLRILHPAKDKAAFTVDEVRKVFNDTIAVIQDEGTTPTEKTYDSQLATNHQNHVAKTTKFPLNHHIHEQQSSLHTVSHSQDRYPPQLTQQSYAQGRTQEQPLIHSETSVWCSLCYNEDYAHHTHQCPYFPTSQEKREVFITTGRCPDCARPEHQGVQCPWHLSCDIHPGERHYTWLCYGQNTRNDTS